MKKIALKQIGFFYLFSLIRVVNRAKVLSQWEMAKINLIEKEKLITLI